MIRRILAASFVIPATLGIGLILLLVIVAGAGAAIVTAEPPPKTKGIKW